MPLKILLPVDGSPYSDMAIETIKAFHFPPQTEVTVMTVVPEHIFLRGITLHSLRKGITSRETIFKLEEEKAAELLKKPVEELMTSGIKVKNMICRGKPAENIIENARILPADLVIIGAKGVSDSSRFRLGSTVQRVMKYVDSSVLIVRKGTGKIESVLFATDGSKHSQGVASFLQNLPVPKYSSVIIVTVLQSYLSNIHNLIRIGFSDTEFDEKKLLSELRRAEGRAAKEIMTKVKTQFEQNGYKTASVLLHGNPAEEILSISNLRAPDLIAVGAKGQSESEAFLMGSVAQRVARFANYSVLIVRA